MDALLKEVKEVVDAGEEIVISCTDFNQEVANLLTRHSYFLITDAEDRGGASGSMLFVKASNPSSSEELQQACEVKKNIVISGQSWAAQLQDLGYFKAEDLKASQPQGGPKLDLYVEDSYKVNVEEVVFPEQKICKAGYVKADAERNIPEGWQECSSFEIDSTKWTTTPKVTLPLPLQHTKPYQNIAMTLVVLPWVKHDSSNFRVKLEIQKLSIGILKSDFLELGFFPDFIKATFKLSWGRVHPSVPIFELTMPVFSGSLVKKGIEKEISMKVDAKVVSFSFRSNWHKEWEDEVKKEAVKIVECEEDGSAATFEWALLRWRNGKRYRNSRLMAGIIFGPKLPFQGTGPSLSHPQIPQVTWVVPQPSAHVELSVDIDLHVSLSLLWSNKKSFVRLPRFSKASFHHHDTMKVQLPPSA